MTDQPDHAALLRALAQTSVAAGAAIMDIYRAGFTVAEKADRSPVTAADEAAERLILAALAEHLPGVPVVAEEEAAAGRVPDVADRFLLVDPLDGTREFIERRGDFTVNIALVVDAAPALGVVYAPATRQLYAGDVAAGIAWTAQVDAAGAIGPAAAIAVREAPPAGLAVVASRSHNSPATDAYLAGVPVAARVSRGSSLKLCLVAAGEADLYPRLAPTCEWDIAAGDAVLRAAGGQLHGPDGQAMRYGKAGFRNPGFVAMGRGVVAPPIGPLLDRLARPA